jgi:Tfp pilus assembly protein FimV
VPSTTVAQPAQPAPAVPGSASTYRVRSGDSLWAIASALLGPGVWAAQIAAEVNRLWDLDRERMGPPIQACCP